MLCAWNPLYLCLCNVPITTGYGGLAMNLKIRLEEHTPVKICTSRFLNKNRYLHLLVEQLCNSRLIVPDKSIMFTMWESSILPKWAIDNLRKSRMIIVPSNYCRKTFIENCINKPVVVVPLGVNTNTYKIIPKPMSEVCTFGIAGTITFRKNVNFVVNAFNKAFANKNAILKIKTTDSSLPSLYKMNIKNSKILINYTKFSEKEMCEWYNSLDALVSCTHSEGFGLHQLEAMACGVPVISPKFGGVTEFFDESVGYCVDYRITSAENISNRIYLGEWCSSIEDSLIEKMLQVYYDRAKAKQLGEAACQRASIFTWDNTALLVIKKINNHVAIKLK